MIQTLITIYLVQIAVAIILYFIGEAEGKASVVLKLEFFRSLHPLKPYKWFYTNVITPLINEFKS